MELGRRPSAVALVAGRATGSCRNMVGVLAGCLDTIVAACAIGGRREGVVIRLGTLPLTR